MKSIELGDYDTFSGLLSLFTAVIGLAYPFILQAIERIQERYITERVYHTGLRKRPHLPVSSSC